MNGVCSLSNELARVCNRLELLEVDALATPIANLVVFGIVEVPYKTSDPPAVRLVKSSLPVLRQTIPVHNNDPLVCELVQACERSGSAPICTPVICMSRYDVVVVVELA